MKRLMLLLLGACLLLTGCAAHDPLADIASTATDLHIPAPEEDSAIRRSDTATLFFRFGTEGLLAPETRTLEISPTAPYELTLLQALLSGPAASSLELSGLYPPGTRVVSTLQHGRTLFVTLSRQIMNKWPDEPDNPAPADDWTQEIRLRRLLGMQAIAATVTENCDVDEVVILVEQGSDLTGSLRLRESYYRTGAQSSDLAAPLTRDETLLLTPQTTLEVILQCWMERDWQRLYPFVARTDPATGAARPAYADFAAAMNALPHLTQSRFTGGSVSPDGLFAVFTLDAELLADGHAAGLHSAVIRLYRERGIWRIGLSQLTEREVHAP